MPFCPKCGYEYEEGIEACPDCDVALVENLSEENFQGDMVEVYTSYAQPEAGLIKELLYNEGIFSALTNELGSSLLGSTVSDMGEIKVFVSAPDADRARSLIEEYIEDNPLEESEEFVNCGKCGARVDAGADTCPYCGEPLED